MLVERGLQVMNVEAVGEAYAIASNYLRKSGAIDDTFATNERLTPDDTDNFLDVYERSNGTTTLVSKGSSGGNGNYDAYFSGSSADGYNATTGGLGCTWRGRFGGIRTSIRST